MRYTPHEPELLKPHTIVWHVVDRSFYEIRGQGLTPAVYRAYAVTETGTAVTWMEQVIARRDVELIAPTHPVYIRWANRRLADRLEGLDRT